MPLWNFIRDIFGGRSSEEPKAEGFFDYRREYDRDNFRNPIWQNDEDDDDIDDFRHSRRGMQFPIYSDPLEITKYFESQMDNILKTFMFGFNDRGFDSSVNVFPFAPPQKESLRDRMLKSGDSNFNQPEQKRDTDLDGKITANNFSNIWDKCSEPQPIIGKSIIGKSIIKEFIRRHDGTIEQKQIFRDSEGNEEVSISQQIGDKIHTVITKKDKNGVETKTEKFINMDESELIGNKWLPSNKNNKNSNTDLNYFPWEKFFKPDPKL
ncbi:uncharacterized protein LOC143187064 [Calliopsis andreniformis]|uniref:uncharacterized protein LOC143187064 n=1 Tax=Calliopsis andreniformis TaxID=337506 RepID=UPI003FCEDFCE